MSMPTEVEAALELLSEINSDPVSPSNPRGLARYGNILNIPLSYAAICTVMNWFATQASALVREQFSMEIGKAGGAALTGALVGIYPMDRSVASSRTLTRFYIEVMEGTGSISGRILVDGTPAVAAQTASDGAPVDLDGLEIDVDAGANIDFEITALAGSPVWAWVKVDGING